jgi:prevent-host-death family protein
MERRHKISADPSRPGKDLREQVFALREKGCSYALIEQQLGIPHVMVKELAREYDTTRGKPQRIIRSLSGQVVERGLISIPVRDLRNDTARIMREVEKGRTFVITVSGRDVAELGPARTRSMFVPRRVVESIIREAPLDRGFLEDVDSAVDQSTDQR